MKKPNTNKKQYLGEKVLYTHENLTLKNLHIFLKMIQGSCALFPQEASSLE
jgi:hypothetical protein